MLATLLAGSPRGVAVADSGAAGSATQPGGPVVGADEVSRPLLDHKDIVWCVAFSPDGRFLVSGGGGEVRLSRPGDFLNAQWGPGRDFALRVWDARTGNLVRRLPGHGALVACVAWSPDGKSLLSGSEDGTLRLREAATGKELRRFEGHTGMVAGAAFAADGTRVLSGSRDDTVRLWDAKTGRELRRFAWTGGRVWDVALSRDGTRVLAGGDANFASVWDAASGRELRRLSGHTGPVVRAAFDPDGRRVVTGSWDNDARVWDAGTGELLQRLQGHTDRVEGVAFSPDGRRVLTGSLDGTVRLWGTTAGKELHRFDGHEGPVARVAFAPDGRTAASAGWDRAIRLWRIPSAYDPTVAWQVFPDAYQPPVPLAAAVRRQLALLDSPGYAAREAATIVLRELGDDVVPLLLRIDPASLTPEQAPRVARLLAGRHRLAAREVADLRKDRAFLLDCLEAGDPAICRAALACLRALIGRDGAEAEFDPDAPPEARRAATDKLRHDLIDRTGSAG